MKIGIEIMLARTLQVKFYCYAMCLALNKALWEENLMVKTNNQACNLFLNSMFSANV